MAGRGRGVSGRHGFESYDYTYDFAHDSPGPHSYLSESWMTSYPTPTNDRGKPFGPGRDSFGPQNRVGWGRYDQERGYGNQRAQRPHQPPLLGWKGDARGGFGGNFRHPSATGGPSRPMSHQQDPAGNQGLRAFTSNSYFGGGFRSKNRRKDLGEGPPEKKSKANSGDGGPKREVSESEGDKDQNGPETSTKMEAEKKQEVSEETDLDPKQTLPKKQQEVQNRRLRDRMVDRIQFVCSLCKFRTFYSEEMTSHLQSDFHKTHCHFVGTKLPKQSADFLQEYISHKTKKTEERRSVVEDLSTTILQIYRDQDLTQDFGMEHFVKKVEAAHCAACDVFIPMNFSALKRHIQTAIHNQNRWNTMENSKKTALAASKAILNNQLISKKLERYIKGQNPFTEEQEEVTGSSGTGLEASEITSAEDTTPHNENLQECSASTSSVTVMETISSEDTSERMSEDDGKMCSPGGQEEFAANEIIEDPLPVSNKDVSI